MGAADQLRTPADAEFAGLYDVVLKRQVKAAGISGLTLAGGSDNPGLFKLGVVASLHEREDAWLSHHAMGRDPEKAPSMALDSVKDSPFDAQPSPVDRDPSTMGFDDLVAQQRDGSGLESPPVAPVVEPLVPPVPDLVPPIPPDPSDERGTPRTPDSSKSSGESERPGVSPAEPGDLCAAARCWPARVPPALVQADADASSAKDLPTVTLNPDGSYTVHDCPPVERVVPREDGSYRVYMTSESEQQRARAAAATAEHAERRVQPDRQPPRSRNDVDSEFAKRFGEQLAANLGTGTSILDSAGPADGVTLKGIRGGNQGARAEPVVIGDVEVVTPGGPASFALAADAQHRNAGAERASHRPLYVTEGPACAPSWGTCRRTPRRSRYRTRGARRAMSRCFAVDELSPGIRDRLPSMPKVPAYDAVEADHAPGYDHYVSGAVRAAGIGGARRRGP